MFRALLLSTFVIATASSVFAQEDASLTKEFAGLSAKERSKLAKQEVEDAAKDEVFKGMMDQAEVAFKAGRFDEARQHYADARERRPLNVYPKVKLEDLDVLIAKRAAEEAARTVAAAPPPVVQRMDTAPAPLVITATKVINDAPAPVVIMKEAIPPDAPPPAPVKTVQKSAVEQPLPTPLTEGERTYMEGNAKVLEITVNENKRMVVYKKVKHPWNQVYYFKDGESVGQRVWQERFGER
ncbi:MAG: hypothetical protein WAU70_00510 [Flavobacteriales bacterium]